MRLKPIGQGITVSVSGASVWLFLYLLGMYEGSDRFTVVTFCTLFGLLMSSIYVVPLGAALGVVVPYFCARTPFLLSALGAALVGVVVAAITACMVAALFDLNLRSVLRSMLPVCVLVILAWSQFLRRSLAVQHVQETTSPPAPFTKECREP